jgi:hypothetical protein
LFLHGSLEHLVGNMLFLWVFGLVVEGKLGWWKFLLCYLGIGVVQSMCEQLIMMGYVGDSIGSLGASAAIFGLMAVAAVWAPMNEIQFVGLFYRAIDFEISIAVLAACYAGYQMLLLVMSGGADGSSWLHLGGMAIGFPLGIALLKWGRVDCEGWDLFHVLRGDYGSFKKEPEPNEILAQVDARKGQRDRQQLNVAKLQFTEYLKQGNVAAAILLHEKMRDVAGGLVPNRAELLAIIKHLHSEKRWADSAPFMADLIRRFSDGADPVRIKLAQICVVELNRPGKALDILGEVNIARLPEQQAILAKRITAKARQMQEEGVVELDVETW